MDNLSSILLIGLAEITVIALDLFQWALIISIIMSWLINFGIINYYQPLVKAVYDFLKNVTEPIISKVRNIVPPIGNMDISPLIVFLAIMFIQNFIKRAFLY